MRFPRMAVPVMTIAVTATAAGCSSGGGLAAHPVHGGSTSPRPVPSTAPPTGTQLGQLLTHTKLPAGWRRASGAGGGATNSGGLAEPGPGPSQDNCSAVDDIAAAGTFIAWWSESNAALTVEYPHEAQSLPMADLALGVFPPGYAAKTMSLVSALASRCRSFVDKLPPHNRVTTSTTVVPHLGDQNLYLTSTAHTKYGNITDQVILARVGNDIVGVNSNDAGGAAVRPATMKGFAAWLAQLLPKLPAGSQSPGAGAPGGGD